jgi:hypothetical protein
MQQPFALFNLIVKQNLAGLTIKDFLRQVVKEHPYFTPAQFYLLQQIPPGDIDFNEQAAKTSLLFNNAHWLNFQLRHAGNEEIAAPVIIPAENLAGKVDVIIAGETTDTIEEKIPVTETEIAAPVIIPAENLADKVDAIIAGEPTDAIEEKIPVTETEIAAPVIMPAENLAGKVDAIIAGETTDAIEEKIPVTETEIAAPVIIPAENLADKVDAIIAGEPTDAIEEKIPVTQKATHNYGEAATEIKIPQQIMPLQNVEYNEEDTPEEKEIAPIKFTLSMPQIKASDDANALIFEPMHLVDYFASQGIKLREEAQPADKLGQQLKSFTEWLKTMKKIHLPASDATAVQSDMAIQNMAEKSNAQGEVLTESMAEVLTQQGKAGKAIEVYKKLSLLNPSKIAYFAAKIEQLKGI